MFFRNDIDFQQKVEIKVIDGHFFRKLTKKNGEVIWIKFDEHYHLRLRDFTNK